jgi:signal transduction histidine kinase
VLQLVVERLGQLSEDATLRDVATDALVSLRSLFVLVQDVTAFARKQPLRLQLSDLRPQALLDNAIRLTQLEDPQASARVVSSVDPNLEMLCGDAARLTQATVALLRTALTSSTREVELRVARCASGVAIDVRFEADQAAPPLASSTTDPLPRPSAVLRVSEPPDIAALGWTVAHLVAEAHHGTLTVEQSGGLRAARLWIGEPS